jgi:hypothetical protein
MGLYSSAASFGRGYAIFTTIVLVIIMLLVIALGVFLIKRQPVYTVKSSMTITSSNIDPDTGKFITMGTVSDCGTGSVLLEGSDNTGYQPGQTIDVFIKKGCDGLTAHVSTDDYRLIGWVMIIVSILLIIMKFVGLYFIKSYKPVAAAAGAADVFNIVKNII